MLEHRFTSQSSTNYSSRALKTNNSSRRQCSCGFPWNTLVSDFNTTIAMPFKKEASPYTSRMLNRPVRSDDIINMTSYSATTIDDSRFVKTYYCHRWSKHSPLLSQDGSMFRSTFLSTWISTHYCIQKEHTIEAKKKFAFSHWQFSSSMWFTIPRILALFTLKS